MNRKLEDKDVFKRFERRNEHTEESTSLGINKHTSVLWNAMHPYTRRRRRRTISVEDSIPLYPLEIDAQSTIVNGSTSFRRVSSSSILGADSQAEN